MATPEPLSRLRRAEQPSEDRLEGRSDLGRWFTETSRVVGAFGLTDSVRKKPETFEERKKALRERFAHIAD